MVRLPQEAAEVQARALEALVHLGELGNSMPPVHLANCSGHTHDASRGLRDFRGSFGA